MRSDESADTRPIDPMVSEPDPHTALIPVVKPSQIENEESRLKVLSNSLAASWSSAADEAYLEWEEYDSEAATQAAQEHESDVAAHTRHEYTDAFSLSTDTSAIPVVSPTGQNNTAALPVVTSYAPALNQPVAPFTETLPSLPVRRRSVLRPSWLKLTSSKKAEKTFDPTVFDSPPSAQFMLSRLIQPDKSHTRAFSIVDHLVGSPYQNPVQAEQHEDFGQLETINFVLDMGEALFRYGAGALEVESSIIAVTAAFGMKNADVDITNQSISLNWAPDHQIPYSRVRVVRSWSNNYQGLAATHELVTDISAGRITRSEAEARLETITREPKPYPRWFATLAGGIFSAAFVSFVGAPPLGALAGFLSTFLVLWITRQLTAWRVPEFFTLGAGGFTATGAALAVYGLGIEAPPSAVVAGGLMILLPSGRFVSAIQDAINGFPITAAGRLVSALIAFAGLTAGIMTGVVVFDRLGVPQASVAEGIDRLYSPLVLLALAFIAATAAAVVEQASWKMLLPTGAVAAAGFLAYYGTEIAGFGDRATPLAGAIVVGALGRVVALRMRSPQLVVAVPALMFMLPGLMIFRGMYQIAIDNTMAFMVAGLFDLFNAMIIVMAIAAGIVLGDVIMRPLTGVLQSNERTQSRRR